MCGGKLPPEAEYPSAEHNGQTYYFCLRACRRVFWEDPEAFLAGQVEHPKDEDPLPAN